MLLSKLAYAGISWWISNALTSNRRIDHEKVSHTLNTDASTQGQGVSLNGTTTGGRWSSSEESHNINYLELQAILLGLQSLCKEVTHDYIRVMTYNTTAVAYVRNTGGSHSLTCNDITRQIWEWCLPRIIWVSTSPIPVEIRAFDDSTEWKLNVDVFNTIVNILGTPTIDMFASRLNHQPTPFVSWLPDPQAMAIDVFTLDWTNHFLRPFPPLASYHSFCRNWKWTKPSHLVCPQLANTAMVPQANKTLDFVPPPAKARQQCPSAIQPRTAPPPGGTASSDGLLRIRKSLQSRGISQSSTRGGQQPINNTWSTFRCGSHLRIIRRAVDPLHL